MLSLQSFLREGRVVGVCWAQLKPEGPKERVETHTCSVMGGKKLTPAKEIGKTKVLRCKYTRLFQVLLRFAKEVDKGQNDVLRVCDLVELTGFGQHRSFTSRIV